MHYAADGAAAAAADDDDDALQVCHSRSPSFPRGLENNFTHED